MAAIKETGSVFGCSGDMAIEGQIKQLKITPELEKQTDGVRPEGSALGVHHTRQPFKYHPESGALAVT